mgnify:CR=1 FL=1
MTGDAKYPQNAIAPNTNLAQLEVRKNREGVYKHGN